MTELATFFNCAIVAVSIGTFAAVDVASSHGGERPAKFSIDVFEKPYPMHRNLGDVSGLCVLGKEIAASVGQAPQMLAFSFQGGGGPEQRRLKGFPNDPAYEVIYICPAGKVLPTPGGLYRVAPNSYNTMIEFTRVDDDATVKRAGMSETSYFILRGSATYLFAEKYSLHKVITDLQTGKKRARIIVHPTAEELEDKAEAPAEREIWVAEGDVVSLATYSRSDKIPSLHKVLKIVPPEESPTGLIGWVELDSTPETKVTK